jgi:hypothetical protein
MRLTHLSLSLLTVLALGAACDRGETPIGGFDSDGCADVADDSGGAVAVEAMVVDCSFYYQDVQQSVRFESTDDVGGTLEQVQISDTLVVETTYSDSEFEGRSVSIRVLTAADELITATLYQIDPARRPVNEFWGDHGFTGLNYVRDPANGETLQYACFASDPADPIHEWEN